MTFFQRFRRTDVPESADTDTSADKTAQDEAGGASAELADWVDGLSQPAEKDDADSITSETAQMPATDSGSPTDSASDETADDPQATETIAAGGLAAAAGQENGASGPDESAEDSAGSGRDKRRARRRVLIGATTAAVLLLGGSGVAVASAHKTIDVDVDGETTSMTTFAGSVDGLLEEAGIEIGPHDKVVPGPDAALQDGTDVVVRTGDQITVVEDGEKTKVWTTALTAGAALSYLGDNGRDASIDVSRSDGRVQLQLPLTADGPVKIVAGGEERTIEVHGTVTLRQALRQAEVDLGKKDEVTVTTGENGAPTVTIVRHSTETETKTESVENEVVQRETDDLYEGQSRVVQEGRDGERTITVRQQLTDGEVTDSEVVSSEITTDPVDRVVEVGTAERPAPEPAPAETSSSQSSGSSGSSESSDSGDSGGSAPTSGVWAKLAQCESGGNPNAVNPAGPYYGLYQFSAGTWHSVGGSGVPTDASAAEQTRRAQMLQARSGWGQWPACAAQLGLL